MQISRAQKPTTNQESKKMNKIITLFFLETELGREIYNAIEILRNQTENKRRNQRQNGTQNVA